MPNTPIAGAREGGTPAARIIRRALRTSAAVLAGLLLSACSTLQFTYKHLDEVAYWWLDGYFDMPQEQVSAVRGAIGRLHRWHRSSELPKYAAWLDKAEVLMPGEPSAQTLCERMDEARELARPLAQQVAAAAAPQALALQPEQFTALERKFAKLDSDYREDWIDDSAARQLNRRARRYVERAENLYGRLDAQQRALLRRQAAGTATDARIELAQRQQAQQELAAVLAQIARGQPPLEAARTQLATVLQRRLDPADPAVRAYRDAQQQEACRNWAAVHATTTAVQRDRARQQLRGWASDLRQLATQPG